MKIISKSECIDWTASRSLSFSDEHRPVNPEDFKNSLSFRIPETKSKLVRFAKILVESANEKSELLIEILEWGNWPPFEHQPLFYLLRGTNEPGLIEKPGHLFTGQEKDLVTSIVIAAILFQWEFVIYTLSPKSIVFVSHDEFVDLHFAEERTRALFLEKVENLGLEDFPSPS